MNSRTEYLVWLEGLTWPAWCGGRAAFYAWLAEPGKWQSYAVAYDTGALPHRAFENALIARRSRYHDARYVEGFVVLAYADTEDARSDVLEHGWLECPGGVRIDPSLPFLPLAAPPEYFAGGAWEGEEADLLEGDALPANQQPSHLAGMLRALAAATAHAGSTYEVILAGDEDDDTHYEAPMWRWDA